MFFSISHNLMFSLKMNRKLNKKEMPFNFHMLYKNAIQIVISPKIKPLEKSSGCSFYVNSMKISMLKCVEQMREKWI